MKTIKNWLAFGITLLLLVVLFGVIFVSLDLATPGPSFFLELGIIVCLTILMRVFWYDFAEDKRLNEQDLLDEKDKYFKMLDEIVLDTNDLDDYLVILNQENRNHFIKNKIGARTAKNMAVKNKWLDFWHPSYRKLTAEEIGAIRYNKLYFKCQRKADKMRQIKSEEIMALSDTEYLYDAKNYRKELKRRYQVASTILSTFFTMLIASIAFKEILLNWVNVFRYVTYLFSMTTTIAMTVIKAHKTTGEETFDWFSRLKFILDKYACYKEKRGGVDDGSRISVGYNESVEGRTD
jgi:hypothetical protein